MVSKSSINIFGETELVCLTLQDICKKLPRRALQLTVSWDYCYFYLNKKILRITKMLLLAFYWFPRIAMCRAIYLHNTYKTARNHGQSTSDKKSLQRQQQNLKFILKFLEGRSQVVPVAGMMQYYLHYQLLLTTTYYYFCQLTATFINLLLRTTDHYITY